MRDQAVLQDILDGARVHADVLALRPDYRALLLAVDGIVPAPSDAGSEALLRAAERSARQALAAGPVEELPHVAAWGEAYRAFGAKPQRTRNSLESLLRRAETSHQRVPDHPGRARSAHRIGSRRGGRRPRRASEAARTRRAGCPPAAGRVVSPSARAAAAPPWTPAAAAMVSVQDAVVVPLSVLEPT